MNSFDSPHHQINDEIRKNRTAHAEVTVLKADNSPLAHQEVVISQTRHKFLFGSAGFDIALANSDLGGEKKELAEMRIEKLTTLCNAVTLPFYWGMFEPKSGQPATGRLTKAAQWCVDHQLIVKGHPLCWHTITADWLLSMSNADILQAQIARIQREVNDFRGLINMWDVLNEAVIMPIFDKYDNGITRICKEMGRIKLIKTVFEAARAANPTAILLLNDFDVSPAYDILVEGCLEAGIPIDAIGIQSHMHQGYWGVEKTMQVLEQFSRFNLPIHFTETNIVSGQLMPPEIVDLNDYQVTDWPTTPEGEDRQAREVIQHYKTLFAHPLVAGITWWDFSDGGWLNAPAGLIRKDSSSKPAYDALLGLVKGDWWLAPTRLGTDGDGRVHFTGFLGEYELIHEGKRHPLALDAAGTSTVEIHL
jgi:GH35 family endo-1,4-beta-xylanase